MVAWGGCCCLESVFLPVRGGFEGVPGWRPGSRCSARRRSRGRTILRPDGGPADSEWPPGRCGGCGLCAPGAVVSERAVRLRSSLRLGPHAPGGGWWHGAFHVWPGGVNQRRVRATGAGGEQTWGRPRASPRPERFMPRPGRRRGGRGLGCGRRACRRRPGRPVCGRRRPWRCCWPVGRGGPGCGL